MGQFNPITRTVHPDDDPDLLAGAVLNSLTRPLYAKLSWGPGVTLVAAFLTGGIATVLAIPGWLGGVIAQHEQQLWYLAEWMRVTGGCPQAGELQSAAHRIRFNSALATLATLFGVIAMVSAAIHLVSPLLLPRDFYEFAFLFPRTPAAIIFILSITLAAICDWIHVIWHQQNVRQFLRRFNQIAVHQYMSAIPMPKLEAGLAPMWIIGGILLSSRGAIWPLPVMLAAAAHRRYTFITSVRWRSMLAEQMRTVLQRRRPAIRVPAPVVNERICIRPNCRCPLSWTANFCPRCGTRVAEQINVVA
ncbi:MAG TPA: hypothetical protein VHD56_12365 [Tepidisphaeraceae bacterium]|nr:hypothetical protein [Tepidisphaeraceae bacterium]